MSSIFQNAPPQKRRLKKTGADDDSAKATTGSPVALDAAAEGVKKAKPQNDGKDRKRKKAKELEAKESQAMMSLISQNAPQKRRLKKIGADDDSAKGTTGSPVALDAVKKAKPENDSKDRKRKKAKKLEAKQSQAMMSLISQNAPQKRRLKKIGADDDSAKGTTGSPVALDAVKKAKPENDSKDRKRKKAKKLEAKQSQATVSLISQNAPQKRHLKKTGADDDSAKGTGSPVALDAAAEGVNRAKPQNDGKDQTWKKAKELKYKELKAKELKARQSQEAEEMKQLESSLFGAIYAPLEFGTEAGAARSNKDVGPLFFVDRSAGDGLPVYEEDLGGDDGTVDKGRKPVWVDDEEDTTRVDIVKVARLRKLRKEADERVISGREYEARLRSHHAKLNPFTGWADMDREAPLPGGESDEEEEGGVDNALRNNDELVVKGTAKLLPGMLDFSRLVDANAQDPSSGPINSVQFHRNGQLMLVAGLDKHLRFFQIDGKRNPKIQSIFIEDCPVHKASFLPDGSEVILSGRRKFFYSFDLVKAAVSKIGPLTGREEKSLETFEVSPDSKTIAFVGNEGYILLVSTKTKQLIGTLKMNGSVRSLAFADGGNQLLSGGGDGHVYHWDLRTRTCMHKGTDEGSLSGLSLCTSPDSSYFAAGSSSGIVNVYKRDEFLEGKRKPLKTIENLTTDIGQMKFNHDAQILAISSPKERNGMRLVHVPSLTVYQNWPGPQFSLHYPRCLDFSPESGFLSIGHAGGKVLLYKLHHYQNA